MNGVSERILAIDGEATSRERVKRVLSEVGLEVIAVADGTAAQVLLDQAETHPFAVVIADPESPGMEDDGLVARLFGSGMMAIVLTSHASTESVIAALRRGVCDYLLKPCDAEELKLAVQRSLEKRRL